MDNLDGLFGFFPSKFQNNFISKNESVVQYKSKACLHLKVNVQIGDPIL